MPRLPEAPDPLWITGGDGRRHRMRYRPWRAPTGIMVELREEQVTAGEGFQFGVLGDHDAELSFLAGMVLAHAETEIGHSYLEGGPGGGSWRLTGDDAAGRLEGGPRGEPPRVVVDGRSLSWEEFGRALAGLSGWRFRLVVEHPTVDLRSNPNTGGATLE